MDVKSRIIARFRMSLRPLEQTLFRFFGYGTDMYKGPVETMLHETPSGALLKDAENIARDFNRVFERERTCVDVEP